MSRRKAPVEEPLPRQNSFERLLEKIEAGEPLFHGHPCPACQKSWRCGDEVGQCDPVCPWCGEQAKPLAIIAAPEVDADLPKAS